MPKTNTSPAPTSRNKRKQTDRFADVRDRIIPFIDSKIMTPVQKEVQKELAQFLDDAIEYTRVRHGLFRTILPKILSDKNAFYEDYKGKLGTEAFKPKNLVVENLLKINSKTFDFKKFILECDKYNVCLQFQLFGKTNVIKIKDSNGDLILPPKIKTHQPAPNWLKITTEVEENPQDEITQEIKKTLPYKTKRNPDFFVFNKKLIAQDQNTKKSDSLVTSSASTSSQMQSEESSLDFPTEEQSGESDIDSSNNTHNSNTLLPLEKTSEDYTQGEFYTAEKEFHAEYSNIEMQPNNDSLCDYISSTPSYQIHSSLFFKNQLSSQELQQAQINQMQQEKLKKQLRQLKIQEIQEKLKQLQREQLQIQENIRQHQMQQQLTQQIQTEQWPQYQNQHSQQPYQNPIYQPHSHHVFQWQQLRQPYPQQQQYSYFQSNTPNPYVYFQNHVQTTYVEDDTIYSRLNYNSIKN